MSRHAFQFAWRDMWKGAFVAAALFAVEQYAISYYLTQTAPGAAFTRIAVRERGDVIRPRAMAVRGRTEFVEEPAPGSDD